MNKKHLSRVAWLLDGQIPLHSLPRGIALLRPRPAWLRFSRHSRLQLLFLLSILRPLPAPAPCCMQRVCHRFAHAHAQPCMPCGCCHQNPVCVNEQFSSCKRWCDVGTQAAGWCEVGTQAAGQWCEEDGGKGAADPGGVQLGERDGGDEAADLSGLSSQGLFQGSPILVRQIPRAIDPDETTDSIQQASPCRADVEAGSPVLIVRGGGADTGVGVMEGVEPLSPIAPRLPTPAPGSPVTPLRPQLSSTAPRSPMTPSSTMTPRPQGGGGCEQVSPIVPSPPIAPSSLGSLQPLSISPAPCEEDQPSCSGSSSLLCSALFSPRPGGQEEEVGSPLRGTASQLVGLSLISTPTTQRSPPSSPGLVYDRSAMLATNMLHLVRHNPPLLRMWASRMADGVPRGRRDCLDLAGKLPLCLKALEIGINPSRLMIDAAQAGGVYGGGDGCVVAQDGSLEAIEVKGCLCRRGKRRAFSFRNIRCDGADWRHLFFVGRLRNPRSCRGSNADVEQLVWVGYVGRDAAFEEMLVASGRPTTDKPMLACVREGSGAGWTRTLFG